jgi:hypothetical protein
MNAVELAKHIEDQSVAAGAVKFCEFHLVFVSSETILTLQFSFSGLIGR